MSSFPDWFLFENRTQLCTPLARRHKVVDHVKRERALLDRLSDGGIVQLHFTFQDALSLYMGLEHCPNGRGKRRGGGDGRVRRQQGGANGVEQWLADMKQRAGPRGKLRGADSVIF